jgi:hypothetical protein
MQPIVIEDLLFHGETIQLSDSSDKDSEDDNEVGSEDDGEDDQWRVQRGRNTPRIQSDQQQQPGPGQQQQPGQQQRQQRRQQRQQQRQQPEPLYAGRKRRFRIDSDQQEPVPNGPKHPLLVSSSDDDEPAPSKRRRQPVTDAPGAGPEGAAAQGGGGSADAAYRETLEKACQRMAESAGRPRSYAEIRQMCHVCAALANGGGWSPEWILYHRARIGRELGDEFGDRPIADMAKMPAILVRMVALYDRYFYRGLLCAIFGSDLTVCWDGRCSKIGGNCLTRPYQLWGKIKIAYKVLLKVEEGKGTRFQSGGIACYSALEAAQLVFEHESVHAVIGAICHECGMSSDYRFGADVTPFSLPSWEGKCSKHGGHTRWFMTILNNMFGHNDYRHAMSHSTADWQKQRRDHLQKKQWIKSLEPGHRVTFDNRGTQMIGIFTKAHRSRAVVHTPDGEMKVPFSLFKMPRPTAK